MWYFAVFHTLQAQFCKPSMLLTQGIITMIRSFPKSNVHGLYLKERTVSGQGGKSPVFCWEVPRSTSRLNSCQEESSGLDNSHVVAVSFYSGRKQVQSARGKAQGMKSWESRPKLPVESHRTHWIHSHPRPCHGVLWNVCVKCGQWGKFIKCSSQGFFLGLAT